MKQLTILACILTSIMLTACVGSVSLPASETKKMDDSETEMMDEPKVTPPNPCIANPFGAGCNDYEKQSFCGIRANAGDNRCTTILSQTNMATWLQSFTLPLRTKAAEENNETSFLRVGADNTIDTTGIAVSSTDAKMLTRAGDSNDGVQFFKGTPSGSNTEHFFAGILPTTDLGLPVPQNEPDATWTGSYRRGNTATFNDVSFDIDFSNRTIEARAGFAESNDVNISNLDVLKARESGGGCDCSSNRFAFNLGFNSSGVIDGTVSISYGGITIDSADATGLIGQDGLVGAFVDATTGQVGLQNFYGGFWAEPDNNN